MDEHLAFLKPDNVSLDEAATIGVGTLVSFIHIDESLVID
jgi:hypothetical protein